LDKEKGTEKVAYFGKRKKHDVSKEGGTSRQITSANLQKREKAKRPKTSREEENERVCHLTGECKKKGWIDWAQEKTVKRTRMFSCRKN